VNLTRLSLSNPVAVIVAVLLVVLFGFISLARLPVQLTPELEQPEITINTAWRAAAPEEVEAEIIEPQEDALRGLPGATKILSRAQRGQGSVSITFAVGADLRRALLEVLNRLNRVPRYPQDADEPVISSVGGNSRAIAWFMLKPMPGNDRDIASYNDFVEEFVQARFERVPGVAMSEVRGGRERELRITFDPYKAANLGIELPKVMELAGSKDSTAGFADVGKRRYTIRFAGEYDVEDLGELVIDWREGRPVLLRDVASVEVRLVDKNSFVIQNGEPAIAINAHRETGINVLQVMSGLKEAVVELREGPLKNARLSIEQVYDETIYIDDSIAMIRENLIYGVILAVGILWWFLRRFRATMIVAVAIPICVIGSFTVMDVIGRTLNVISLAGLAFAVGMVLDAAIVVLENIVRLRERGEESSHAALHGTAEVWGAVLASTLTTIAIFLPVVFLEEEAGQLFADLALTITVAVVISLIVAITVLPAAAVTWLRHTTLSDPHEQWWDATTNTIMRMTDKPLQRVIWIVTLLIVPVALTWALKPDASYLPEGNRNLVFTFINPPPGNNIDTIEKEMGRVIADYMKPYIDGAKQPHVSDYFFVAFSRGVFMGARSQDPERADELVDVINNVIRNFPDTIGFAFRSSLFGGFGEGHTIDVDIQGRDVESLLRVAGTAFGVIREVISDVSIRPFPGLELAEPELRLVPDERHIAEAGWNRKIMTGIIRALGDGLYVGDYFDGDESLDIILRAEDWDTPEELTAIPLATPKAGIQPLGELIHLVRTSGPDELRRIDRRRTVTLQVRPPSDMPLDVALQLLKEKVEPVMLGMLPEDGAIRYGGTADKLQIALKSMAGSFMLAMVILYLLMSALFRSFLDSLLTLLVIPLATVGGVILLRLTNLVTFQPMDLLTMMGFVILLGLIVNNAILLVYQTRAAERAGLPRNDAVRQAVRVRLRPILMSTLTCIFGMLPLWLMPGAGSELYRGLAAVIVGGMSVSTLFTLVLLPSFLRIGEGKRALPVV